MIVQLLTEHHLEFLSLQGGCRGLSKSTHVKMPHCWKSHATAHVKLASTQELSTCLHIETLHTYTIFIRVNLTFCCLLITSVNCLDSDHDRQNVHNQLY